MPWHGPEQSARIATLKMLVDEANAERGDRGCRLASRAFRVYCGMMYTAEEIARLPVQAREWLIPDDEASPMTPEERLHLIGVWRSLGDPLGAWRPIVRSYAGNRHAAERIAKRMQKRAHRRADRRDQNALLREHQLGLE